MIPLCDPGKQYYSMKNQIDKAIRNVFQKGIFILGENVSLLEKEFARYCGVRFGIGVGSGTEALHLSLIACGVKEDDEVITVANTAVATIAAISFARAKPVFVDIDSRSFTIDVNRIEEKISKRTKVIIPVHLYGQMADMRQVMNIARRYNLKIIEDACQAHGAEYENNKAGSMGNIGCFSFYPTKNLGCYGDGGMIVTNDAMFAKRLYLLRNYGQYRRYYHIIDGYNSRLDEIQAAILRVKLKKLNQWNRLRRNLSRIYKNNISTNRVLLPEEMKDRKHVYHLYVIRTKKRDRLRRFLLKNGVLALTHYPIPVHLQEAYKYLKLKKGDLPVSEQIAKEILSLPIFPELSRDKAEFIAKNINLFYRN